MSFHEDVFDLKWGALGQKIKNYTNINMTEPRNEYLLLAWGKSIIEGIIKDIIKDITKAL